MTEALTANCRISTRMDHCDGDLMSAAGRLSVQRRPMCSTSGPTSPTGCSRRLKQILVLAN